MEAKFDHWGARLKINILFLLVGVGLSVLSKVLQLGYKSKVGDVVVFGAAIFFVLAILFSIDKFTMLVEQQSAIAWRIGFWCCAAVVSFQLTMVLTFGYDMRIGLLFLFPFVMGVGLVVYYVINL